MFNIYENTKDGRVLLGTCSHAAAEIIRSSFLNIEFEDVATSSKELSKDLPALDQAEEWELICAEYGVSDKKTLENAKLFMIALAIGGIGCFLALVTELVTK